MVEQLDEHAIRIIHPPCGSVLLVTALAAAEDLIQVEGICYRCDRYIQGEVRLRLGAGEDLTLAENKKRYVLSQIHRQGGIIEAGRVLKVGRPTIYRWLSEWGRKGK